MTRPTGNPPAGEDTTRSTVKAPSGSASLHPASVGPLLEADAVQVAPHAAGHPEPTGAARPPHGEPDGPGRRWGMSPRQRVLVGAIAALVWAAQRSGLRDVVNPGGWSSFARFWRSVADPELGAEFLRLSIDSASVTLSYAVLGSLGSLVIGALGALLVSETVAGRGLRWRLGRFAMVVPRAVHEILWALLLVHIFGFDPLVAVIAIAVPFGAVTAKVFAETIDEADRRPYAMLRSTGAGTITALCYGIVPQIRGELLSYAFYRFECAIRSAAVLGVIGAGGLGFQLDLSFETLRYEEIWTLIFVLMALSGAAEQWSSAVRGARRAGAGRVSLVVAALLVPLSVHWSGLRLGALLESATWERTRTLVDRMLPPRLGLGGWGELLRAGVDTVAVSILTTVLATTVALGLATISRRRNRVSPVGFVVRLGMLLARAVPAPIWAFLFVLVLFPGMWPGIVALAIYNVGVLGRLFTEVLEEADPRPAAALEAIGASAVGRFFYGVLPVAGPRLVSLAFYRWEVIVRETVVVGVVGAGGLGQLINEHLAARDFAAVTGALIVLVVVALAIDEISARIRSLLR